GVPRWTSDEIGSLVVGCGLAGCDVGPSDGVMAGLPDEVCCLHPRRAEPRPARGDRSTTAGRKAGVAELFQADDKNGKACHASSTIMSALSTELPCQGPRFQAADPGSDVVDHAKVLPNSCPRLKFRLQQSRPLQGLQDSDPACAAQNSFPSGSCMTHQRPAGPL